MSNQYEKLVEQQARLKQKIEREDFKLRQSKYYESRQVRKARSRRLIQKGALLEKYFQANNLSVEQTVVDQIVAAQPDMVFVATGFPKQEFFIAEHRQRLDALWMGVGGSFDVIAGAVKRAPLFWQKHHVEWLYRLIQEPSRFKRMLVLPRYLRLVKKIARQQAH